MHCSELGIDNWLIFPAAAAGGTVMGWVLAGYGAAAATSLCTQQISAQYWRTLKNCSQFYLNMQGRNEMLLPD